MLGRLVRYAPHVPIFHTRRTRIKRVRFLFSSIVRKNLRLMRSCPCVRLRPRLTPPPAPAPATYAPAPALTITHALAPRAMLLYNVCESLAHEAPIRHNGCKFDPVSAVPWEDV